jgi:DNA-binding HxlR family transcriptional regulator
MGMDETPALSPFCAYFHHAVELIGARWSGAIIRAMLSGVTRFSDLTAAIPGLSDRMLSERLKELEAEGIVERCVTPSTPVRVDYRLTDKGRDLAGVFESISAWSENWLQPAPAEQPARVRAAARR